MSIASMSHTASSDEADIRAVIDGVHQSHRTRNAAAIAAPYTVDAVIFDLAPPLAHPGMDAHQIAAWLDTWQGPLDIEVRDFKISVSGDLAFCHGFYQLGGMKEGVPEKVVFWMRATVCLRRQAGIWRIVHEHTSVPFYMDGSFLAAVDLQPPSAPPIRRTS